MEYSRKRNRLKILKIIILTILIIVMLSLVYKWTIKIEKDYKRDNLRENVEELLEVEGERGLLSLAGVTVNEIFYDENGVSLILGDSKDWNYTSDEKQNIDVYENCNKSVVYISNSKNSNSTNPQSSMTQSSGSGVVLSKDGQILTNSHVVSNSKNLIVTLSDGTSHLASLIGMDEVDDIAVLKIEANENLVPIKLGRSNGLKIGQKVLAIGNPFGYDRTLTTGIVSGLNRAVQTSDKTLIIGMIQTDASINPGNSGGPLLNGHGEMIGMNASIYNLEDSQGMNFAIPIDTILSLLPDLLTTGKVLRGWLDIIPVQLTKQLAKYANLNVEEGVLISQVVENGQAEDAGLLGGTVKVNYGASTLYLGGDVIIKINDRFIHNYNDYYNALLTTKNGDRAKITIIRDNKEIVKTVTLVERQEDINKVNR